RRFGYRARRWRKLRRKIIGRGLLGGRVGLGINGRRGRERARLVRRSLHGETVLRGQHHRAKDACERGHLERRDELGKSRRMLGQHGSLLWLVTKRRRPW